MNIWHFQSRKLLLTLFLGLRVVNPFLCWQKSDLFSRDLPELPVLFVQSLYWLCHPGNQRFGKPGCFLYQVHNCVTQLKLYTGYKLSSSIFSCLCVCLWGICDTRPNLHLFQYIQAYKPFSSHAKYTWSSSEISLLWHFLPGVNSLYFERVFLYNCSLQF